MIPTEAPTRCELTNIVIRWRKWWIILYERSGTHTQSTHTATEVASNWEYFICERAQIVSVKLLSRQSVAHLSIYVGLRFCLRMTSTNAWYMQKRGFSHIVCMCTVSPTLSSFGGTAKRKAYLRPHGTTLLFSSHGQWLICATTECCSFAKKWLQVNYKRQLQRFQAAGPPVFGTIDILALAQSFVQ